MTAPDTTRQAEAVKPIPCPFCGNAKPFAIQHNENLWSFGCYGKEAACCNANLTGKTAEEAESRWSRRAAVPVQDMGDERAKFEAYCAQPFLAYDIVRRDDGGYIDSTTQSIWVGWQARAKVQAGSASSAEPVALISIPTPDGCHRPYNGCTCSCHRMPGVKHFMPCCTPTDYDEWIADAVTGLKVLKTMLHTCKLAGADVADDLIKTAPAPMQSGDKSSNATMPAQQADSGKEARNKLMREAEKAAYAYACEVDVGLEREKAFEIYENIRTAGRVY